MGRRRAVKVRKTPVVHITHFPKSARAAYTVVPDTGDAPESPEDEDNVLTPATETESPVVTTKSPPRTPKSKIGTAPKIGASSKRSSHRVKSLKAIATPVVRSVEPTPSRPQPLHTRQQSLLRSLRVTTAPAAAARQRIRVTEENFFTLPLEGPDYDSDDEGDSEYIDTAQVEHGIDVDDEYDDYDASFNSNVSEGEVADLVNDNAVNDDVHTNGSSQSPQHDTQGNRIPSFVSTKLTQEEIMVRIHDCVDYLKARGLLLLSAGKHIIIFPDRCPGVNYQKDLQNIFWYIRLRTWAELHMPRQLKAAEDRGLAAPKYFGPVLTGASDDHTAALIADYEPGQQLEASIDSYDVNFSYDHSNVWISVYFWINGLHNVPDWFRAEENLPEEVAEYCRLWTQVNSDFGAADWREIKSEWVRDCEDLFKVRLIKQLQEKRMIEEQRAFWES